LMGMQGTAYAHTTEHAWSRVTCSRSGCNNLDPELTGCVVGAYTVRTAVLPTAFIQLRYSPRCGTNWGRLINRSKSKQVYLILVERIDGVTYGVKGVLGHIAWTRMVYASRVKVPVPVKARVCVSINGSKLACSPFM
jgi:hypothetical protein